VVLSLHHSLDNIRAALFAVLVHAALFAILVVNLQWSQRDRMPQPQTIQAVVVQETPRAAPTRPAEREQADQQRARDAAQAAEAAKRRRDAEAQARRVETAKKKRDAERKAAADAAARKRAAEAKRQEQAEQQLQRQLAAEEAERTQAQRAAAAHSEASRATELIRRQISQNWNQPAMMRPGLKCTVRVRLTPGGTILGSAVIRSSGDMLFDNSAEAAVRKAAPLAVPQDATTFELYFREFDFEFDPEKF
jgi:colicin import membrane protein